MSAIKINFHKPSHVIFFAGILPFLSLFISWLFFKLFPALPFWMENASPLLCYGLLYSFFEKKVWHFGFFHHVGIVQFPDLRGRWKGSQSSSFREVGKNVKVASYLEISQTFSGIFVRAYYEKSQSESSTANFAYLNGETALVYTYDNEPNSTKIDTMKMHKGTVKLKYSLREKKLMGTYFNSNGNHGEMLFEYEQPHLLGRFK